MPEQIAVPFMCGTLLQLLGDLADIMVHNEVHHVPILRDGVAVGIVSRHDMLRAFTGR